MKHWKTIYRYVNMATGEVNELRKVSKYEKDKTIIIIKQEKTVKHAHAQRTTTITKYYRPSLYKQPELYTTS